MSGAVAVPSILLGEVWHNVRVELGWLGCRVTSSLIYIIYIKLLLRMRCRAVCASFLARDGEKGKGSES